MRERNVTIEFDSKYCGSFFLLLTSTQTKARTPSSIFLAKLWTLLFASSIYVGLWMEAYCEWSIYAVESEISFAFFRYKFRCGHLNSVVFIYLYLRLRYTHTSKHCGKVSDITCMCLETICIFYYMKICGVSQRCHFCFGVLFCHFDVFWFFRVLWQANTHRNFKLINFWSRECLCCTKISHKLEWIA